MRRILCILAACAALTACSAIETSGGEATPRPASLEAKDQRDARLAWWREARYGMFVHFGPFSQWPYYREKWSQFQTRPAGMPVADFDRRFTAGLTPRKESARQWAHLAKLAGMKYMVFTAKHHEGFCLWDSKLTDYNSVKMGPGFDMVRAYVDACRAEGLKVGLYYSLLDGHHPDGHRCVDDEAARQRFLEYTRGLVRELMSNFGPIALLWYDGPTPLGFASEWESECLNRMVRQLQPGIIINDRSLTTEDFTCSEGHITAPAFPDQDWEACMTFNGVWGWQPAPPEQYCTSRKIIDMLHEVSSMTGNLLLNVGPNPVDGSIGPLETQRLLEAGKWLQRYGEGVYGHLDRVDALSITRNNVGATWTRRGNTAFLWMPNWPKGEVAIEKVKAKINACSLLGDGKPLPFQQKDQRVTINGLPAACPDPVCQYPLLKIEFASYPR
jgi:alpha-L-fucosidase